MIRVGVLGLSPGNGHPFSFSAIVNGYSDEGFAEAGWPVIHDYLRQRAPDEFGFDDVRVTHAWTQSPEVTDRLCAATNIPSRVTSPEELLGHVDAVLLARDDWESHVSLARVFLDAGVPTFVDKPLTLDSSELNYFRPFLEQGKLMSCSGLRFARELSPLPAVGEVRCTNGVVVGDWARYGIHLIDAVFGITSARPISLARNPGSHESFSIAMDDSSVLNVDAIGAAPKTFRLSLFGTEGQCDIDLHDNFSAFRATLKRFFEMCRNGIPPIAPADTLRGMQTLIAGMRAQAGGPHVRIGNHG